MPPIALGPNILITNALPMNTGDEALLRGAVNALGKRWPDAQIRVLTKHVQRCKEWVPDLTLDTDLEYADGPRTRGIRRHETSVRYARVWGWTERTPNRARIRRWYQEADVVVSAPGGFLHDHYGVLDRLHGLEVAMDYGKPVVLFAQSVGPFWKRASLRAVPRVLNRLSAICVRDEISREHLLACGVCPDRIQVTADAAFMLHTQWPGLCRPKTAPVKMIGLSFRPWPTRDARSVRHTMEKAALLCKRLLAVPGREILFLSTCQGVPGYVDDSALAVRIVDGLSPDPCRRCRVDREHHDARSFVESARVCDAFIGMRLHGCLLSMLGGVPAMGLGYEHKTEQIFTQLGLRDYQVRFDRPVQDWLGCTERFLQDVPVLGPRLPAILQAAAERAERTVLAVEAALEGPHRTPVTDGASRPGAGGSPGLRRSA